MISNARLLLLTNSPEETTFMNDDNLPSLPVPNLDNTLDRYLISVTPFLSNDQLENTRELVESFRKGEGPKLQKMLLEKAAGTKNWLYDWWMKYAYLMQRDPISPSLNMAGPQSLNLSIWPPNPAKSLEQAALSMWAVMDFYLHLRKEKLRPHVSKKGQKLNMDQFRRLFNTARIPQEDMDRIDCYFKTESEGGCPNHIVVICNGHIWKFSPFFSEDEILSVPEIEDQLKYIKRLSYSLGAGNGISALTFDNRDNWAKNREWLQKLSKTNRENLQFIESAVLAYSLDSNSPKDISEVSKLALCADPTSRWADKSYGAVTFENGYHASANDHSPFDAMTSVTAAYFQHEIITDEFEGEFKGNRVVRDLPKPKRLAFHVDDRIEQSIKSAKALNAALRDSIGVKFSVFPKYGKNWIKEQNVHPDAFLQCSLQLAYFKLHKKLAPTYETATTRRFYRARTETIRSCTPEMASFVRAFVSDRISAREKKSKLIAAVSRHVALAAECESGHGIDRHLMGLYLIALENGIAPPDMFADPAFTISGGGGNFVLSTSTIGYTLALGGVAAMVKHGYGIFYSILPNRLHFFLTNFVGEETCLEKLSSSLSESLEEMRRVLSEPQNQL